MRRMIAALGLATCLVAPALAQNAPRPQGQTQARPAASATPTLNQVRQRNQLLCGVNGTLPGFSAPDPQGAMRGFDADFCRAVAAAVLGDANRVRFLPMATPEAGFEALANRQIDILARNATITLSRDTSRPITAGPVIFYDGMGFMVPRALNVTSPRQLGGKTICWAGAGSTMGTAGENLSAFAQRQNLTWTVRRFDTAPQAVAALTAGECHALAADAAALAARRVTEFATPDNWMVLAEIISAEPLAPWVRNNDEAWRDLIFWIVQALIRSEYFGITSQNIPQSLTHSDWRVRHMLGVEGGAEGGIGRHFSLPNEWVARMIAAVGNYGEVFERNLGRSSIIGMDRGLNDQWTRGGLIYGMPTR